MSVGRTKITTLPPTVASAQTTNAKIPNSQIQAPNRRGIRSRVPCPEATRRL